MLRATGSSGATSVRSVSRNSSLGIHDVVLVLGKPLEPPGEVLAPGIESLQPRGDVERERLVVLARGAVGLVPDLAETPEPREPRDLAQDDHDQREHDETQQAGGDPADPVVARDQRDAPSRRARSRRARLDERRRARRAGCFPSASRARDRAGRARCAGSGTGSAAAGVGGQAARTPLPPRRGRRLACAVLLLMRGGLRSASRWRGRGGYLGTARSRRKGAAPDSAAGSARSASRHAPCASP